ncbi:uncharacterized protein LOC132043919 [Lycium ferocissimum]|uniref:uncharacterized protein LOC132043919 n=1 Tax=Lycium ferocissimum TaxID=112874 RepID=UPI0028165B0E|nr:uncharacterized protein LOC132043919 [Lycium ferocissimum]
MDAKSWEVNRSVYKKLGNEVNLSGVYKTPVYPTLLELYSLKAQSSMADAGIVLVATFSELTISWLNLRQQNSRENLFQTHPRTMNVAVKSLVMCWLLYGFQLRYPRLYVGVVPLAVDFFGSLSTASALSCLLPDSVRPIMYFLGLLMPKNRLVISVTRILQEMGKTMMMNHMVPRRN